MNLASVNAKMSKTATPVSGGMIAVVLANAFLKTAQMAITGAIRLVSVYVSPKSAEFPWFGTR